MSVKERHSSVMTSQLLVIVWIYVAHEALNALLLSSLNPYRCVFWNQKVCTEDEAWMCNWVAFCQLHLTVLLACIMSTTSSKNMEIPLSLLCCSMIVVQFGTLAMDFELLHRPLFAVRCIVYAFIMGAVQYFIRKQQQREANSTNESAASPRKKTIPTVWAARLQLCMLAMRFVDMAFGTGQEGYLGDTSSPIYQSMLSISISYMALVVILFGFGLRLCTDSRQLKNLLYGQALVLFLSQIMLACTQQGAKMKSEEKREGIIGTFIFIVIAFAGAF